MWTSFALAVALMVLCLYAPGCLLFRAFGAGRAQSFACAPLFSLLGYCILGALFPLVGLEASFPAITAPVACVALAVFAGSRIRSRAAGAPAVGAGECPREGCRRPGFSEAALAAYLAAGVCVALYAYVSTLNGADSFAPTYDNVFHYSLIRSFVDSSDWSALHASAYPLIAQVQEWAPLPGGGYYPAAWHLLCALAVDAVSVPVPLAANAANAVMAGVVYPAGMCLFMLTVFPARRGIVFAGAILAPAFGAFPGVLLDVWPLFPNALSLSLVLPMAVCFMVLLAPGSRLHVRVLGAMGFLCGVALSVFTQPNAVFTVAVLLIPFCVQRSIAAAGKAKEGSAKRVRFTVAVGVTCACGCVAVWAALYHAPFLQSLVQYNWAPVRSTLGAIASVVDLRFTESQGQPLLALLVCAGIVGAIVKRRYLWIACAYALACVIYCAAASLGDVPLKHFLSGFWYTDCYRVAAFAAVFAVPLASLGAFMVVRASARLLEKIGARRSGVARVALASALALAFCIVNFRGHAVLGVPDSGQAMFGALISNGTRINDPARSWVYDAEEIAFVERAKQFVPEGSLVVNQPYDGSALSYAISGMESYYRDVSGYGSVRETQDSVAIRTSLSRVADDPETRASVGRVGAEYVMILSRDDAEMSAAFGAEYDPLQWQGINGIQDGTEGFEVVLAEGEMRLYRIVGAA